MAFIDLVKSVYQHQHKAKPRALTSVEEGKNVRILKQAKERHSRRIDTFISNRAIVEDDFPLTPQSEDSVPKKDVTDPRKKQMLLWKKERMLRKKLEPKKAPPFKVGVVRHAIAPFQEEIFKNCVSNVADPPVPNQRVTRSSTRAISKVFPPLPQPPKSFAPPNAKFHAPKVNIVERKNFKLKYTPKKPKTEPYVRPFSNLFPNTKAEPTKIPINVKPKATKSAKSKKTNLTKISKTPRVMKNSKKDDFLIEIVKEEIKMGRLETSNTISQLSTPKNNPKVVATPESAPKAYENGNETFTSPEPSSSNTDLVISSPYVTVGRGKTTRQQEDACKIKFGYSRMSPEKTAQYFRLQLDSEVTRLQDLCRTWKICQEDNDVTLAEDSKDLINLAIGQTQLLINKKFEQFRGLIFQCENKEKREGEGVVTVQDLQGFWDMVYMQVENVDVRFNRLQELKNRDWKEDIIISSVVTKAKKKAVAKTKATTKPSSSLKEMIRAARNKSKAQAVSPGRVVTRNNLTPKDANTKEFNAGFFSVISPVKNKPEENEKVKTPNKRVSMLKSVIASEAKKRLSSKTPPSTSAILKASCLSKNVVNDNHNKDYEMNFAVAPVDLNKTPGKSILKTPGTTKKTTTTNSRKSVKVLFIQEGSDDDTEPPSVVKQATKSLPKYTNVTHNDDIMIDDIEAKKPRERKRITRQNATEQNENHPPLVEIDTKSQPSNKKSKKKKTPTKTRRNTAELTEESEKNTPIKTSRLTQDFFTDLQITNKQNALPAMCMDKSKSLDDRRSFNLISFSPAPVHNTRSALRRMSTNTPTA